MEYKVNKHAVAGWYFLTFALLMFLLISIDSKDDLSIVGLSFLILYTLSKILYFHFVKQMQRLVLTDEGIIVYWRNKKLYSRDFTNCKLGFRWKSFGRYESSGLYIFFLNDRNELISKKLYFLDEQTAKRAIKQLENIYNQNYNFGELKEIRKKESNAIKEKTSEKKAFEKARKLKEKEIKLKEKEIKLKEKEIQTNIEIEKLRIEQEKYQKREQNIKNGLYEEQENRFYNSEKNKITIDY